MDLKALDNMNSNGIITAPINVKADVAAVLGESTTSVSALCKSNKINMWAKWKPIPYGSIETPSKEVKKSLNYGLTNFAWGGRQQQYNKPSSLMAV